MTATLTFSTATKVGIDLDFLMTAMADGMFLLDASSPKSALFTMDASGTEILPGAPQVTAIMQFTQTNHGLSFSFYDDGDLLGTGTFKGIDIGFTENQIAAVPKILANLTETQVALNFKGHRGDDLAHGSVLNDRLAGRHGHDVLFGDDGDDRVFGGSGNDYLSGDDRRDILNGGRGHDMLRGGTDNARLSGGRGNDVIDAGGGENRSTGGAGADVFVFDTGSAQRTVVQDFSADDLLLFTGVATTASGTPDGYTAGDTLADVSAADLPLFSGVSTTASGTPDGFTFRETGNGYLIITMENLTVALRDTTREDVDLEQLYFSSQTTDDALTAYGTPGSSVIGTALTGSEMVVSHSGTTTQLGYGSSGIMFETYMGDVASYIEPGADLLI